MHTRIDETIARVAARLGVGNLYVNRNLVGAVVGVQPFGGEGLSGTGPKAGGPLYMLRMLARQPVDAAQRAVQALGEADGSSDNSLQRLPDVREQLQKTLQSQGRAALVDAVAKLFDAAPASAPRVLPGPTGERNSYSLHPRRRVLCLAERNEDRLLQGAAVLAVGAQALWPADAQYDWAGLPVELLTHIAITPDWRAPGVDFDAVLLHGDAADALNAQRVLAARPGPIVGLTVLRPGATDVPLARLLTERSTSVNTAAAGGNASLMTLG